MNDNTILVVDDEPAQRDALADFFVNICGFQVLTAESGDLALELLAHRKQTNQATKAIVMDIKMPGRNGIDTSLEIKQHIDRNIPIIFNTAFPDQFREEVVRDQYLFFAYQTKGDDFDELAHKVERAVRHYDLMSEQVSARSEDSGAFTVHTCEIISSPLPTRDLVEEMLLSHRGRPDLYLSLVESGIYRDTVRVWGGEFCPRSAELVLDAEEQPAKAVFFSPLTQALPEAATCLKPGGQAIFVTGLAGLSRVDCHSLKQRLNEQGFRVESIQQSADRKLVIDARKPLRLESSAEGLVLVEALSDREMRDYYEITRQNFDLLQREIDMSFDQVSAHFVVYRQSDGTPISTIRVVPKSRIRLPLEFGLLPDGSACRFPIANSAEISHLANLSEEKARGKEIGFRVFGEALKMVFSAALHYCISRKIETLALTCDEGNPALASLYAKLGFQREPETIGYAGYPERYLVMHLRIEDTLRHAVRTKNRFQLAVLQGVVRDPAKTFILVHDAMFQEVLPYRQMIEEVAAEVRLRLDGIERPLVLDLPVTTGNLTRLLADRCDLIGADISPDALAVAEGKARERNPHVAFQSLCADISKGLPLADGIVDAVASVNLLYWLSDSAAILREMARVLKPGGWLVLVNLSPLARLPKEQFLAEVRSRYGEELARSVAFWKDSDELLNLAGGTGSAGYLDRAELSQMVNQAGLRVDTVRETFLGAAWLLVARKF